MHEDGCGERVWETEEVPGRPWQMPPGMGGGRLDLPAPAQGLGGFVTRGPVWSGGGGSGSAATSPPVQAKVPAPPKPRGPLPMVLRPAVEARREEEEEEEEAEARRAAEDMWRRMGPMPPWRSPQAAPAPRPPPPPPPPPSVLPAGWTPAWVPPPPPREKARPQTPPFPPPPGGFAILVDRPSALHGRGATEVPMRTPGPRVEEVPPKEEEEAEVEVEPAAAPPLGEGAPEHEAEAMRHATEETAAMGSEEGSAASGMAMGLGKGAAWEAATGSPQQQGAAMSLPGARWGTWRRERQRTLREQEGPYAGDAASSGEPLPVRARAAMEASARSGPVHFAILESGQASTLDLRHMPATALLAQRGHEPSGGMPAGAVPTLEEVYTSPWVCPAPSPRPEPSPSPVASGDEEVLLGEVLLAAPVGEAMSPGQWLGEAAPSPSVRSLGYSSDHSDIAAAPGASERLAEIAEEQASAGGRAAEDEASSSAPRLERLSALGAAADISSVADIPVPDDDDDDDDLTELLEPVSPRAGGFAEEAAATGSAGEATGFAGEQLAQDESLEEEEERLQMDEEEEKERKKREAEDREEALRLSREEALAAIGEVLQSLEPRTIAQPEEEGMASSSVGVVGVRAVTEATGPAEGGPETAMDVEVAAPSSTAAKWRRQWADYPDTDDEEVLPTQRRRISPAGREHEVVAAQRRRRPLPSPLHAAGAEGESSERGPAEVSPGGPSPAGHRGRVGPPPLPKTPAAAGAARSPPTAAPCPSAAASSSAAPACAAPAAMGLEEPKEEGEWANWWWGSAPWGEEVVVGCSVGSATPPADIPRPELESRALLSTRYGLDMKLSRERPLLKGSRSENTASKGSAMGLVVSTSLCSQCVCGCLSQQQNTIETSRPSGTPTPLPATSSPWSSGTTRSGGRLAETRTGRA